MSRRTTKILAIIILLCFLPAALAIVFAILVHPAFLFLLLVIAFSIPFFRAARG
jgi:hypothetical protein